MQTIGYINGGSTPVVYDDNTGNAYYTFGASHLPMSITPEIQDMIDGVSTITVYTIEGTMNGAPYRYTTQNLDEIYADLDKFTQDAENTPYASLTITAGKMRLKDYIRQHGNDEARRYG